MRLKTLPRFVGSVTGLHMTINYQHLNQYTMTQLDFLRKIFKENDLGEGDFFKHKHYTIITRSGIEKIQYNQGIDITFDVIKCERDFCVVRAEGVHGVKHLQTFGSASTDTSQSKYYMEMAEKRALSRIVLKLVGLYESGVFGEDEGVQDEKDELATVQQIAYIEGLLQTSLLDENQMQEIERGLETMTEYQAKETAEYLRDNQQEPITQGNYSQTEANNFKK